MTHALFGAFVALAWFFVLNLCATAVLLVGWPLVRRSVTRSESAFVPLAWRLVPAVISMFAVIGFVVPAYVALEPPGSDERVGWIAILLAAGGIATIAGASWRGLRSVRRTLASIQSSTIAAQPLAISSGAVRAFTVSSSEPVLMLTGVVRPRLYVSRRVVETLSAEELRAPVAHELAHHRARDNAKRRLIAFVPDLFSWTRAAGALVSEWHARAELSADRTATQGSRAHAVHLASALVKVARLGTGLPSADPGYATLHDGQPIARRVRRLLQPNEVSAQKNRVRIPLWWRIGTTLLLVVLSITSGALPFAQAMTELLVRLP